jgi:hypothetical protein
METIENQLTDVLVTQSLKFKDNVTVKSFEKALKNFDTMVEKGLVAKRGYNLLSIEESFYDKTTYINQQTK